MPTRRQPLNRSRHASIITPASLAAFKKLYEATTPEEWRLAHDGLADLISDRPWPWPCVATPDTRWDGHTNREDHEQARRNWDQLENALLEKEARPERREKRRARARHVD